MHYTLWPTWVTEQQTSRDVHMRGANKILLLDLMVYQSGAHQNVRPLLSDAVVQVPTASDARDCRRSPKTTFVA